MIAVIYTRKPAVSRLDQSGRRETGDESPRPYRVRSRGGNHLIIVDDRR
jgi:predicted metalloprotease